MRSVCTSTVECSQPSVNSSNRGKPFAVLIEDGLTHDEHVAKRGFATVQYGISVFFVIRVTLDEYVVHVTQIFHAEMPIGIPMLFEIAETADTTHVIAGRGDNVPAIHARAIEVSSNPYSAMEWHPMNESMYSRR